ncbi:hypothetical protein MNQ98_07040 [Paenibacillus sp. N3/727]|uniref:hypothetical protein n=1 Tax=Paenibacillus sp. N3/727 TaxID=2925845 RepID=UPI001F537689|nr:hypothetical protein [Paenibacillus sp. N3/727]UNK19780.1 hypothetical protein MNQ98_07040 [Paenibacillus sp. N3/727]
MFVYAQYEVQKQKTDRDGREYRYLVCSRRRRQGDAVCNNNFWLPYYPFRDELIDALSNTLRSVTSAEQLLKKTKDSFKSINPIWKAKFKNCKNELLITVNACLNCAARKCQGNFMMKSNIIWRKIFMKDCSM